jgi:hypothetical protein
LFTKAPRRRFPTGHMASRLSPSQSRLASIRHRFSGPRIWPTLQGRFALARVHWLFDTIEIFGPRERYAVVNWAWANATVGAKEAGGGLAIPARPLRVDDGRNRPEAARASRQRPPAGRDGGPAASSQVPAVAVDQVERHVYAECGRPGMRCRDRQSFGAKAAIDPAPCPIAHRLSQRPRPHLSGN